MAGNDALVEGGVGLGGEGVLQEGNANDGGRADLDFANDEADAAWDFCGRVNTVDEEQRREGEDRGEG